MPVMESEKKSTLTIDEEELMNITKKIQQNLHEDEQFSKSLDKYLASPDTEIAPITIGATPISLAISGANPDLNVVINPSTVRKCMSESDAYFHGHGLSAEIIKQIPSELRNPALIFKGSKENSLVAITELKDKENRGIMVAVSLSEKQGFREVNRISSAYGRNNMSNYLKAQMEQGNLIAVNQEKAERMLHSLGLQLPQENTFLSFNDSIAYSTQNVKFPTEKNTAIKTEKTSESLLPVLNAIYQKHEDRIDSLQEKRETRENKIAKNTVKLDKLTAKVERLQQTNVMLKGLSGGVLNAPIQALIQRNQRRIDKIQNTSIPNRQAKIEKHMRRIDVIDHKIAVSQAKSDKIRHLDNAIKSFTIRNPEERRQQFTQSMDGLQDASKKTLSFKIEKCDQQIASLSKAYGMATNSMEQLSIGDKIQDIQARKQALLVRMSKLRNLEKSFAEHTPEQVEHLLSHTEAVVDTAIESGNAQPALLAETVVTQGADYLRNAELSMEQNYNNIDGVVNNLPPEKETSEQQQEQQQTEAIHNDIPEQSEQSKELEEKETVPDEVSQSNEKETVDHAEQSVKEENWLSSLVDSGAAKINKNGTFCINPDYYHQIPAEDVHMESFKTEQAMGILENLAAIGISFTALSLTDTNIVTIAIDNRNTTALHEFAEIVNDSIQVRTEEKKTVIEQTDEKSTEIIENSKQLTEKEPDMPSTPEDIKTEKHMTEPIKVNPEYYASLPKQERLVTNESRTTAEKIMQSLDSQNIPYSAVERSQGETIAITVSKENEQAFRAVESAVKTEHGKEYINPEFYKKLSKEERYTQRMTESEARQAIQELKQEGVDHSAVIDGNQSKITIHKKDKGAVFFSRKQLHKQHERIQHQERTKPQQQKNKEQQKGESL